MDVPPSVTQFDRKEEKAKQKNLIILWTSPNPWDQTNQFNQIDEIDGKLHLNQRPLRHQNVLAIPACCLFSNDL